MEGSAEHSRCACVDRPSRSPHEQFRTQSVLRIKSINTAVEKRCASRTEFASRQKIRRREPGRDVKIRCDRMLPMKDSADIPVVHV